LPSKNEQIPTTGLPAVETSDSNALYIRYRRGIELDGVRPDTRIFHGQWPDDKPVVVQLRRKTELVSSYARPFSNLETAQL
jgi:hypothetical protein